MIDNPPAYPHELEIRDSMDRNCGVIPYAGATLLDYFAAYTLMGNLAAMGTDEHLFGLRVAQCEIEGIPIVECNAREAFEQAKAMLIERQKVLAELNRSEVCK